MQQGKQRRTRLTKTTTYSVLAFHTLWPLLDAAGVCQWHSSYTTPHLILSSEFRWGVPNREWARPPPRTEHTSLRPRSKTPMIGQYTFGFGKGILGASWH